MVYQKQYAAQNKTSVALIQVGTNSLLLREVDISPAMVSPKDKSLQMVMSDLAHVFLPGKLVLAATLQNPSTPEKPGEKIGLLRQFEISPDEKNGGITGLKKGVSVS